MRIYVAVFLSDISAQWKRRRTDQCESFPFIRRFRRKRPIFDPL